MSVFSDSQSSSLPLSKSDDKPILSWLKNVESSSSETGIINPHLSFKSSPSSNQSRATSRMDFAGSSRSESAFSRSPSPVNRTRRSSHRNECLRALREHRKLICEADTPPRPIDEIDYETHRVEDIRDTLIIEDIMARIHHFKLQKQLRASCQELEETTKALETARKEAIRVRNYHYMHGLGLHYAVSSARRHHNFTKTLIYKSTRAHVAPYLGKAVSERRILMLPTAAPFHEQLPVGKKDLKGCDGLGVASY